MWPEVSHCGSGSGRGPSLRRGTLLFVSGLVVACLVSRREQGEREGDLENEQSERTER